MLNPYTGWTPGQPVTYQGSLTSLHGTYRAYPCTCQDCETSPLPTARFALTLAGQAVLDHVRSSSITPIEDEQHITGHWPDAMSTTFN